MIIRPLNRHTDMEGLRDCLIELQDFERTIDPRMPPGAEIADDYIFEMLEDCETCDGAIIVADDDGHIAGYATILTRVQTDSVDDGDVEFGLISDLVVQRHYRRSGYGLRLIREAEAIARAKKVRWLRISVLAANQVARRLYTELGYKELHLDLEKDFHAAE